MINSTLNAFGFIFQNCGFFRCFFLILCLLLLFLLLFGIVFFIRQRILQSKELKKLFADFKNPEINLSYIKYVKSDFSNYPRKISNNDRIRYITDQKILMHLKFAMNYNYLAIQNSILFFVLIIGIVFLVLFPIGIIDAYKVSEALKDNDFARLLALNAKNAKFVEKGFNRFDKNSIVLPIDIKTRFEIYKNSYFVYLESEENIDLLDSISVYFSSLDNNYEDNKDIIEVLKNKLGENKVIKKHINLELSIDSKTREIDSKIRENALKEFIYYLCRISTVSKVLNRKYTTLSRILETKSIINMQINYQCISSTSTYYTKRKGFWGRTDKHTRVDWTHYSSVKILVNGEIEYNEALNRYPSVGYVSPYDILRGLYDKSSNIIISVLDRPPYRTDSISANKN